MGSPIGYGESLMFTFFQEARRHLRELLPVHKLPRWNRILGIRPLSPVQHNAAGHAALTCGMTSMDPPTFQPQLPLHRAFLNKGRIWISVVLVPVVS
jgi:hypothetical protein